MLERVNIISSLNSPLYSDEYRGSEKEKYIYIIEGERCKAPLISFVYHFYENPKYALETITVFSVFKDQMWLFIGKDK